LKIRELVADVVVFKRQVQQSAILLRLTGQNWIEVGAYGLMNVEQK